MGLYTAPEAARYARITTSMMNRWVHGNKDGRAVVRAQRGDDPDRTVTFVDFIQVLAIRELRRQQPAPSLNKIRTAYREAVDRYGLDHPFAYPHKCFYDGKNIWIQLPWRDHGSEELFTQMTGRGKGQSMIREIAEIYTGRIQFEGEGRLASGFTLYHDELGRVYMDPNQRFGEPLLPSGHTVFGIADAYKRSRDAKAVASDYEISQEEVILALRCDDFLDLRAAA